MELHAIEYHVPLVVLSVVVSIVMAYVSLELAGRASSWSMTGYHHFWLFSSASSMGIGIWLMHFIGMLAQHYGQPVHYDLFKTVSSLFIAVGVSLITFWLMCNVNTTRYLLSGLFMGAAIASMHYTGIAAIVTSSRIVYLPVPFLLSILFAVVFSYMALFKFYQAKKQTRPINVPWKLVNALCLGAAVSGMHYVGNYATVFVPGSETGHMSSAAYTMNLSFLAIAGGLSGVVLAALLFLGVFLDRRITIERSVISSLRWNALFEHHPDMLFSLDFKGRITMTNPAVTKLTGYTVEELHGSELLTLLVPEDRDHFKIFESQTYRGIPQNYNIRAVHKAGAVIHLNMTAIPVINQDKVIGVHLIGKDLTDQMKSEEKLKKAEKLAVIGNLAAGIAHEIRNPLTTVKGLVQFMRTKPQKPLHYETILSEVSHIESIVTDFLMLAASSPSQYEWVDLKALILKALERTGIPASKLLQADEPGSGLPSSSVFCDPIKLGRVFNRLFMEVSDMHTDESPPIISLSRTAGGQAELSIWFRSSPDDSGNWMSHAAGELHYNTKEQGTGVVFMVAYHTCIEHGGNLEMAAEAGGTSIQIRLPVNWHDMSAAL
ncbi:MHYT domain-containing protein [Paenibacillus abyssi]|uniref:histidine kinase n=1 Tax=Paenibacillus abyssi TaxID=1340531 RepID=A0A917FNW2_9BACL|nr:MHYT domain-containing protein [Paenibacillus abyssi]GGF96439.1 hypothetical protein GCM10010916_12110 [Paenibacillus abyssi]